MKRAIYRKFRRLAFFLAAGAAWALFATLSFAQVPQIEWVREFGTPAPINEYSHAVDAEGNVYIVGISGFLIPPSAGVETDGILKKYDADGNEIWFRRFGSSSYNGAQSQDLAYSVAVDATGIYVGGSTNGTLPGQTPASPGSSDGYVIKYDFDGNQIWTREFAGSSGVFVYGLVADATGIYVTGYTIGFLPGQMSSGDDDIYVRKYDLNGNEVWTVQFGTNSSDRANAIAADSTGVYVTGQTWGTFPGQPFGWPNDAFVAKLSLSGTIVWIDQFGVYDHDTGTCICAGSTGVYAAGRVSGSFPGQTSSGGDDAFVRKYDPDGNVIWTRQFGGAPAAPGFASDMAWSISSNSAGIFVGGRTNGILAGQLNSGGYDAFVRLLDVSGGIVWTRQFGTERDDSANAVSADVGALYVLGDTFGNLSGQGNAETTDIFLRKYDLAGADLWTRQFGMLNPGFDVGQAVDAIGNVYLAGSVDGALPGQTFLGHRDAYVRKYDASGNELWTRQFGTTAADMAYGVSADINGVCVAGYTDGVFAGQASQGLSDMFLCRLDAEGNILWVRQFGTSSYDYARGVSIDPTGIYVAGWTRGAFPGQTNVGDYDVCVCKFDLNGNLGWAREFGSSSLDYLYGLTIDPSGIYVAGMTAGSLPGQTSAGYGDSFIRKYDSNGNAVWTRQFGTSAGDACYGICSDATGVYAAGAQEGMSAYVAKYDPDGNAIWTRPIAPSNGWAYAWGVSSNSGGVYVAGYVNGAFPGQSYAGGYADGFVRGFDSYGNVVWTIEIGTPSFDVINAISADEAGIYFTGQTGGSLLGQTGDTSYDAFIVKLGFNSPPVAEAGGPYSVAEGHMIQLSGAASVDPDNNIAAYEWDLDGDGQYDDAVGVIASFLGVDDGVMTVGLKVTDDKGASSTDTAQVTVLNAPPKIISVTAPIDPVPLNTSISFGAEFTDAGVLDTHAAVWDWGGGTSTAGTVTETNGSGAVAGSHTYTTPGIYTVTLTVTDDDGGVATATSSLIVVYNPTGEFVTGAGWFMSPAGAFVADPALTGKAHFGIMSKYQKGAMVPTGETKFQFQAADLSFRSEAYEWMVVAGAKVQYKGTGTINGSGSYRFMITAIDGDIPGGGGLDKFRIRIWGDSGLIYDNEVGSLENGDPTTVIAAGSIVIHK